MPIGIQRLNARKLQPNPHIVFIKPLKGPDERTAQDFLERIAAQCAPIMRHHHLNVMSLEEYEPNAEFVGRNFNAGEVIQLVLKSRHSQCWLPFNYVQLVMMHELAHCQQMNHSRAFWDVRNKFAEAMRALWADSYTGDGMWGRGALLGSGKWEKNTVPADEALPEQLCGGTYRSRRRKRKPQLELSSQAKKERRILRKFGAHGVALGCDHEARVELEKGKQTKAKPRVAGSARGRDLRVAAALARLESQKSVENTGIVELKAKLELELELEPEPDPESKSKSKSNDKVKIESDSESDYEEDAAERDAVDAADVDGTPLSDASGRIMIKVCGDGADDEESKHELLEMQTISRLSRSDTPRISHTTLRPMGLERMPARLEKARLEKAQPDIATIEERPPVLTQICPMCSVSNTTLSVTCVMCANVLDPPSVPGSWCCAGQRCAGSAYVNAGDCGVCGVCGSRRPPS